MTSENTLQDSEGGRQVGNGKLGGTRTHYSPSPSERLRRYEVMSAPHTPVDDSKPHVIGQTVSYCVEAVIRICNHLMFSALCSRSSWLTFLQVICFGLVI